MAVNRFQGLSGLGDIADDRLRRMLKELSDWAEGVSVPDVVLQCEKDVATQSIGDVETTYDNVTTSATSPPIKVDGWRTITYEFEITKTLAPTNITFQFQTQRNGSSDWHDEQNAESSVTIAAVAMPTDISMTMQVSNGQVRIEATATGTSAVNKITVTGGVSLGG